MIIVSITGPTMQEAGSQIRSSRRYADLFELRLDMIRDFSIAGLLGMARKPCIATCRPRWEGGAFDGTESQRIEILEAASLMGVDYVDIELNADRGVLDGFIRRKRETKVVVSLHLHDATIFSVKKIFHALHATHADVVKLAYTADDAWQIGIAREFLGLARKHRRKAIAIAMGEAGEASRVLYRKFGGWATYAAPEVGQPSADGQIRASRMKRLYRSDKLTSATRVYGVLGNPVRQSKGVFVHNPLFQRAGRNAVYTRFPVKHLARFLEVMGPFVDGLSITVPHKQEIVNHIHRVDKVAAAIGAVNTVVKRGDRFHGTNTDAAGALDALEKVRNVSGMHVVVIGAGGAARAIAYEAVRRGARITIANRTEPKGRKLARELGCGYTSLDRLTDLASDILMNTTSVGMAPDVHVTPVPRTLLRKNMVVFDAVYSPPVTRLLAEAKQAGATVVSGVEMYVQQAALQSELYTGKSVPVSIVKRLIANVPLEEKVK